MHARALVLCALWLAYHHSDCDELSKTGIPSRDGPTNHSDPYPILRLPTLPPNQKFPEETDGKSEDFDEDKISVISLWSDTPTSVKILFRLPANLVGQSGSVDLRYTDKEDDDVSHWSSQVHAADEVLTKSPLEFRLTGLKPSTKYRVRGRLHISNVQYESDDYSVKTQDNDVEEKRREIDCKLQVVDVNDTSAHVSWRHFNEDELQFIDGIQVRYRPVGTPIYIMTERLHHSRSNADLHDLRPGSKYEASLVLVPPPRTVTELHDPASVEFNTAPYVDPYNWSVIIEATSVGSEACSLSWRGVPSPAERWVRVYRAAHACGSGPTRKHDPFRLAARVQQPQITLSGLEPDTRCRVWLELFLTNWKVKTSNVLEVNTKPLDTPEPIDKSSSIGPLVILGVIAAASGVAIVTLLLLRRRAGGADVQRRRVEALSAGGARNTDPLEEIELQQV